MLTAQIAFTYMATASVASAFLAVTRRSPVHAMLWVLALFLHVAGIFLLLGAEFLAAVQVIVYAGAILIFYLFVLMLLDLPAEESGPRFGRHWLFAAAVGLSFAGLAALALVAPFPAADPAPVTRVESTGSNVADVGLALFGPFALPFEITGLILLAAVVGAVVLARRKAAVS